MTDRRFSDDEVAAIFERAAKAQPPEARPRPAAEGMTLAQLQEIGREVGMAPDAITQAVSALEQRGVATARRMLGIPIGVGRVVELPRKLTDDEWERLVADLRETFDARGVLRSEGSMREWSNGNLHVLLEPTVSGQRLRFRTVKGTARAAIGVGVGIVGYVSLGLLIEMTSSGIFPTESAIRAMMFAAFSLGGIGLWLSRLPAWARTRGEQMEGVAERLIASLPDTRA